MAPLAFAGAPGLPAVRHDKEGEPFDVRLLSPGDRSELSAFYYRFEPKRAAQGLPPKGDDRVDRWLDTIIPRGIHLLAWRGPDLIGHAFLVDTGKPGVAEYAVFLREDARGRGVGTELNRVTIEVARAAALRRLWLSVEPGNRAAIRSYEKAGFRFLPGTIFSPEMEMELEL